MISHLFDTGRAVGVHPSNVASGKVNEHVDRAMQALQQHAYTLTSRLSLAC